MTSLERKLVEGFVKKHEANMKKYRDSLEALHDDAGREYVAPSLTSKRVRDLKKSRAASLRKRLELANRAMALGPLS